MREFTQLGLVLVCVGVCVCVFVCVCLVFVFSCEYVCLCVFSKDGLSYRLDSFFLITPKRLGEIIFVLFKAGFWLYIGMTQ